MQLENVEFQWKTLYKIGAVAALSAVALGVIEILITFLPGGNARQVTVQDWFALFQQNPFMGLRNLGLLNIFLTSLSAPIFFALYGVHRQSACQPVAALALLIAFVGMTVFFADNRAFPMLALSREYAVAGTDSQRGMLEAAGKSLLSVGQSHTPGTFLGFFISEIASILMSLVLLKGGIFSKATAIVGLAGFGLLMVFEFFSSFFTGLSNAALLLAMVGGLLTMAWYILLARRLFQLARR